MQPLKIVIALVTLIVLAIAIGSNLSPIVTVVVLSQPTIMLPVGVWFIMAIGLGLLSSITIQLLVWLQSRTLVKKIRQLQSRLQDVGEDVFTYAPPPPPPESSTSNTRFSARDNFESSSSQPNFTTPPPVKPPAIDDNDDWEYAPVSKPQPEWEDLSPPAPPPRQQTAKSEQRRTYTPPILDDDLDRREGVYDADFRLIQPPYKATSRIDDDDDEYEYDDDDEYKYDDDDDEINDDDDDDDDDEDLTPPPQSPQATPKNDSESEDWGFDFDEKPPLQPPRF
jgi:uncharacterized membrane protein YciS (DUF1049 family)